jgi:hypothetical protein
VVAADSGEARKIAKLLREVTGTAPLVVLHTEANAARKLAQFTESRDPWLVAVNMVSEGVDIPRLRVGVYATAAKTPLLFRQIVGRFVRTIPGREPEPSWLYLPADPVLRDHAAAVETELRHVLRVRAPGDDEAFDEPRERRGTERSEAVEFVPLAADVIPQMSLFGPPPGTGGGALAPAPPRPAPVFPGALPGPVAAAADGSGDVAESPPGMAAFERRALLRDKRHTLVGELRRRDGRAPREINAWLNRAVGVTRVEDATLEQLERSCALLLDELTGTSSRR